MAAALPSSYRPTSAAATAPSRGERPLGQLRPIHAKVGVVARAVGSAYVEAGSTKIICVRAAHHVGTARRVYH
jgi:ribonuclease PH